jgi:uncharacterized protein (TIGR00251 family)
MTRPEQAEKSRGGNPQITCIAVKVTAGAANSAISGWHDQHLRIRLSTVPERGKANAALIAMLAKSLELPRSAITIVKGQHNARKTIAVEGLSQADIMARIPA